MITKIQNTKWTIWRTEKNHQTDVTHKYHTMEYRIYHLHMYCTVYNSNVLKPANLNTPTYKHEHGYTGSAYKHTNTRWKTNLFDCLICEIREIVEMS